MGLKNVRGSVDREPFLLPLPLMRGEQGRPRSSALS